MFAYNGRNKKVILASHMSNLLMQNHMDFHGKVACFPQYDMTECDSADILSFMKDRYMNQLQEIRVKRFWNPWTSAVAAFNPKYPNRIILNSRRIGGRSADSIVGSIMHEFVHLVDNYYTSASFGHGDNYKDGKENTAPYKIGAMAKAHCEEHID
jgi:hypothetical protein